MYLGGSPLPVGANCIGVWEAVGTRIISSVVGWCGGDGIYVHHSPETSIVDSAVGISSRGGATPIEVHGVRFDQGSDDSVLAGCEIGNCALGVRVDAPRVHIRQTYVGVSKSGVVAQPTMLTGVFFGSTAPNGTMSDTVIGGAMLCASDRETATGCGSGVMSLAPLTTVSRSYIGIFPLPSSGGAIPVNIGNAGDGVTLRSAAEGATLVSNIISFNGRNGILSDTTNMVTITGNIIGTFPARPDVSWEVEDGSGERSGSGDGNGSGDDDGSGERNRRQSSTSHPDWHNCSNGLYGVSTESGLVPDVLIEENMIRYNAVRILDTSKPLSCSRCTPNTG